MKDNLFLLVYRDYDVDEHYFFSGPSHASQKDFEKLCDQLVPKAGYRVVLNKTNPRNDEGGWICWRDVVEALVSLLEEQGYQRISIETYCLQARGTIIGTHDGSLSDSQLGFAGPLVADYNRKLEKKIAEERKIKRKLSGLLKKKTVQIIK